MPPLCAPARPRLGSVGPSASSSAGPAPGTPAQGGHNPPHTAGPPPQHPGVPQLLPTHCGATSPRTGTGGRSAPAHGSAHAASHLRRWGFRGAAAAAPPAGSGTHQLLCVFHQALMGRSRLLPLRARPRGLGRCRCPRSGPGPATRGQPAQFSRSERRGPSGTDCGHRDINNTSEQLRRRGHAPARIGLRGAAPLPFPPYSGRIHSLLGVGTLHQGGCCGG